MSVAEALAKMERILHRYDAIVNLVPVDAERLRALRAEFNEVLAEIEAEADRSKSHIESL
jgi:hypothetical protein